MGFGGHMTEVEIFDKVREKLSELLDVDKNEIEMESSFIDDLNADSLDIVDLVLLLENEFEFQIPDEDAERIRTVGDAVKYIKQSF